MDVLRLWPVPSLHFQYTQGPCDWPLMPTKTIAQVVNRHKWLLRNSIGRKKRKYKIQILPPQKKKNCECSREGV